MVLITIGFYIGLYLVIAFIFAKLFWAFKQDDIDDRSDAVLLGLIWPLSVLCLIAAHSLEGVGNVFNAITSFMEKKL